MTKGELIKRLNEINVDDDTPIEFAIHTYTQAYPSVYVPSDRVIASDVRPAQPYSDTIRVYIHTPEGVTVSVRKKAEVAK